LLYSIAVAFNIMVNKESYKCTEKLIHSDTKPLSFEFKDAIGELERNAGTQFDQQLGEVFIKNVTREHLQ